MSELIQTRFRVRLFYGLFPAGRVFTQSCRSLSALVLLVIAVMHTIFGSYAFRLSLLEADMLIIFMQANGSGKDGNSGGKRHTVIYALP